MKKVERQYLKSLYFWFNERHNLNTSLTTSDMQEILKSLKIYNQGIFEVLSLVSNEYDEDDLLELFTNHEILILE